MQTFSNSPLVTYENISPNRNINRKKNIDTITIHCVVGQCTAKSCCDYFAIPKTKASSNYVVGKDGGIGLSVEEKDKAWTTGGDYRVNGISGGDNDESAITIEVASDNFHPYKVTDAALEALIELCADICKRNNIKKLIWKADKSLVGHPELQNMTVHRWFANKACPGDYLYNKMGEIAEEVNRMITVYNTVDELPSWAKTPIQELINKGYLNGTGNGLNLSEDLTRTLVILHRILKGNNMI